jgi:hypothetical protein
MRAGRSAEATAMLARRPDTLPASNAYVKRLRMYRGEIAPEALFAPPDTGDVDVATLAFEFCRVKLHFILCIYVGQHLFFDFRR